MVSEKKEKESASSHALRLLNEHLANGDYTEGARLPPERTLADELSVSRRALREALGLLEAEGRIWRGVGQGTFVGGRPLNLPTDLAVIKSLTSPSKLMESRLVLEPPITALAALHATTNDMQEAWRCLKKSAGVSGAQAWELWDGALHRAIANAAHNALISVLFDTLNSARTHTDWGRLRSESLTPDRQELYTAQHRAILTAISDRDSKSAAQAMQAHLLTVKETQLSNWEDQLPAIGSDLR